MVTQPFDLDSYSIKAKRKFVWNDKHAKRLCLVSIMNQVIKKRKINVWSEIIEHGGEMLIWIRALMRFIIIICLMYNIYTQRSLFLSINRFFKWLTLIPRFLFSIHFHIKITTTTTIKYTQTNESRRKKEKTVTTKNHILTTLNSIEILAILRKEKKWFWRKINEAIDWEINWLY